MPINSIKIIKWMTIRYTPPTMKAYPREALDRFFKSLNRFPRISTEPIMLFIFFCAFLEFLTAFSAASFVLWASAIGLLGSGGLSAFFQQAAGIWTADFDA